MPPQDHVPLGMTKCPFMRINEGLHMVSQGRTLSLGGLLKDCAYFSFSFWAFCGRDEELSTWRGQITRLQSHQEPEQGRMADPGHPLLPAAVLWCSPGSHSKKASHIVSREQV